MPFVNNLNPTLLQLGPFEIRWYGIVYALGFLLVYYVLNRARKEGRLELSEGDIDNFVLLLAAGIIIGARIFHIFLWNPGYYLSYPLQMLFVWKGGLSFHGGLTGAILVSYYFCRRKGIAAAKMADLLVIPAALMLAFGRIANFINGELWGNVTNVRWCVKFQQAEGCRHPSQLYEAVVRFAIAGMLAWIRRYDFKDGFLFWSFMGLMGAGRFFVDFFREDAKLIGLSMGQYLSIAMIIASAFALYKYYKSDLWL